MIRISEEIEKLAEQIAKKTGKTPQQAIHQALEEKAREIGLSSVSETRRKPGRLKDQFEVPVKLFDPLSAEELEIWQGGKE